MIQSMACFAVKFALYFGCMALAVPVHAQEGYWSWTDRAERNAALYGNIQSIALEYEYAEIGSEHLNRWSSDQWREWWDSWPAGQDEITTAQLNAILLPEANRQGFILAQVQSCVQGDNKSAVLIQKFSPNAVSKRVSENRHLRVERTDGPRQSHVVSALPFGGSGSWGYPVAGREVFCWAIIGETLLPALRAGRVSPRGSDAIEISGVELPGMPEGYSPTPRTYVVDRRTGTAVEYLIPGRMHFLHADARQLSNGCIVPFRILELRLGGTDGTVSRVRLYVVRECLINQDFGKQFLHSAKTDDGIFVDGIPVQGGPWLLADTPIDDVLKFVEERTKSTPAVIDSGSTQWLMWAILVTLIMLSVAVFLARRPNRFPVGSSVPKAIREK